ncbi:37 kDa salivary gland allergen Aed a 2-like [Anopheles nili]|uniref:37 kDa salivary gland allergen Aed a 2-like n=1 Tax=Anopheles nili TaxID=185578 RepID=UPI00237A5761|nr:37 kDa salivary gland allergen Aed a 2-like [Anopheles nili]
MPKAVSFAFLLFYGFIVLVQTKTIKECEKEMPLSLRSKLCEMRQFKNVDGPEMDKHMDCVLKSIGFVNAEGQGFYHNLIKPMNAIERDRKHDFNLETCMGKTQRKPFMERAHAFYRCMLDSTSSDTFKKVFDLTELINAGKLSAGTQYGPRVAKMAKRLNKNRCK